MRLLTTNSIPISPVFSTNVLFYVLGPNPGYHIAFQKIPFKVSNWNMSYLKKMFIMNEMWGTLFKEIKNMKKSQIKIWEMKYTPS